MTQRAVSAAGRPGCTGREFRAKGGESELSVGGSKLGCGKSFLGGGEEHPRKGDALTGDAAGSSLGLVGVSTVGDRVFGVRLRSFWEFRVFSKRPLTGSTEAFMRGGGTGMEKQVT